MQAAARKLLMSGLVAAFVTQTCLVYTDPAIAAETLDAAALRGRATWHRYNCQTCHQLYGFGGFLGPDLTNAASRLTRARLDAILTEGSRQMPPFHMTPGQIDGVEAFLKALDHTGKGQASAALPIDPTRVETALDEQAHLDPLSPAAQQGRTLFRGVCSSCHRLFQATPLGPFLAPDLSTVRRRLTESEIRQVLKNGRPQKGMMPQALSPELTHGVLAFFTWLDQHRDDLLPRVASQGVETGVPWFEFR